MEREGQGTQGAAPGNATGFSDRLPDTVQNVDSVTTHGDLIQAGGNVIVNVQHHYHNLPGPTINILDALRLVPNFRKIHLDILSKATPGTGVWFFKTKDFLLWLDSKGQLKILWGTGIPGAGKSVMASIVINDLEARAAAAGNNICVAYVYFRYSDAVSLTLRSVLAILVKQTVERHQDCAFLASRVYARHLHEGTHPTEAELLQLLRSFTKTKLATFYVLDALDEAPEKLQVILVKELALLNVRLFISSRPLKAVEAQIPAVHGFSIMAQDSDLDLHITQEISNSRGLQALLADVDSSFREEVLSSIKKNCGGMFLHASLQLDAIGWCNSPQDIMDTLEEFPSEVEDVYHQTWKRICNQPPKSVSLAKATLIWVLNASRPMTIEELRHAISTSSETHKFQRKRLVPGATLVTLCCGLVTIEDETRLVRLVHYTAQGTLQKLLHDAFPHPHSYLGAVCMTHLSGCGLQNTMISSKEELIHVLAADPLLSYSFDAWADHARKSLNNVATTRQVASFVSECTAFPSFITTDRSEYFDVLSPLHILAFYNLPTSLIKHNGTYSPNIVTRSENASPLLLASWFGNVEMVRELLRLRDTQINISDKNKHSPLMLAAFRGHTNIVELLLAHQGIQVNLVDNDGWSALRMAASRGHEGIIKLLLARPEIQHNLRVGSGWSALMNAAHNGQQGTVKLLLAHPEIQANLVDHQGWSALINAAHHGHEGTVKQLLAHLAIQVNLVDHRGWSALMHAVYGGQEGVAALLLAHAEIQVNLADKNGWSAMTLAASRGHEGVVRLLLAHPEIQINLATVYGSTALKLAGQYGHESTFRLLLRAPSIDTTKSDVEGNTPLSIARAMGHHGIVRLFQEFESQSRSLQNHRTPMLGANSLGSLDVTWQLSDKGIQVQDEECGARVANRLSWGSESEVCDDTEEWLLVNELDGST